MMAGSNYCMLFFFLSFVCKRHTVSLMCKLFLTVSITYVAIISLYRNIKCNVSKIWLKWKKILRQYTIVSMVCCSRFLNLVSASWLYRISQDIKASKVKTVNYFKWISNLFNHPRTRSRSWAIWRELRRQK